MLKFPLFHKRKKQVNVEISINNGNTIADTCYISPEAIIGRNCILEDYVGLNGKCVIENYVTIGKLSSIQDRCIIESYSKIGAFCSIAPNVRILSGQHPTNFLSTHPFQYDKGYPLDNVNQVFFDFGKNYSSIGNDAWIGQNVVVMDNLRIPDGVIIGANSVVTHSPPPYSIIAGVPAKVIRYRFEENIIKRLVNTKWWLLPLDMIKILPFNDIEACLDFIERHNKGILKS